MHMQQNGLLHVGYFYRCCMYMLAPPVVELMSTATCIAMDVARLLSL